MVRMLVDRYAKRPAQGAARQAEGRRSGRDRGCRPLPSGHSRPDRGEREGDSAQELGTRTRAREWPRPPARWVSSACAPTSSPRTPAHYDGVVRALRGQGPRRGPLLRRGGSTRARRWSASSSDKDGRPTVDAVVSLTGFSLVGGPAYNDSKAAEEIPSRVSTCPTVAAQASEFPVARDLGALGARSPAGRGDE